MIINNSAMAGCAVGGDWPNAPCYDTPGAMPSKETLRELWAPYYQYKGFDWMEMMKTQMINSIKNGTIKDWIGYNDAHSNVFEYYFLNDQVPFFIPPGAQNYTKPDHVLSPLQQFKSGTPVEDTQCRQSFNLWLKQDGVPVCITTQSTSDLLSRGFLSSDSYKQFAINEANRFIRSSPTFETNGIEDTLKLIIMSIDKSTPPVVSIQAIFDSPSPGYGDKSTINSQPQLTHHIMSITISNTNKVTQATIDRQWDELHQKLIK